MDLDSPTAKRELIVHLGMTGRLSVSSNALDQDILHDPKSRQNQNTQIASPQNSWAESAAVDPDDSSSLRHLRAVWTLDDGRCLYFDDVRRFGRIAVVAAAEHHSLATLAALGPEPFDDSFTPEYLRMQINSSKRCIKTQLLAQRVVAGLGNIYVDEALWRSQVHPAAKRLTVMQAKKLRDDIRDVLSAAISNGGTTLRNYRDAAGATGSNQRYLDCYGRAGQDCLRCGSTLKRIVIDARATVYCPRCQKR
jgi:formamidopyrimidine-DNA glycosylase